MNFVFLIFLIVAACMVGTTLFLWWLFRDFLKFKTKLKEFLFVILLVGLTIAVAIAVTVKISPK